MDEGTMLRLAYILAHNDKLTQVILAIWEGGDTNDIISVKNLVGSFFSYVM